MNVILVQFNSLVWGSFRLSSKGDTVHIAMWSLVTMQLIHNCGIVLFQFPLLYSHKSCYHVASQLPVKVSLCLLLPTISVVAVITSLHMQHLVIDNVIAGKSHYQLASYLSNKSYRCTSTIFSDTWILKAVSSANIHIERQFNFTHVD